MSILEINGSSIIAMTGKNCVAIASDTRFGVGGGSAQTLAMDIQKVFQISEKLFIGLPGLLTDAQTFAEKVKFRANMYRLNEEREMSPKVFSNMVASMLYQKRFGPYYVEPLIAGLTEDGEPFISGMDLIGAPVFAKDFVLAGTSAESLFGMAESLWRPDLNPDELFEAISQSLVNAFDRDATSGWGATVHVITPEAVITRQIKTRQD